MQTRDKRKPDSKDRTKQQRVPCRGCTQSCRYYDTCEGKPWRLNEPEWKTVK